MSDSRHDTFEHIKKVRKYIAVVVNELKMRAFRHDQSKLSAPEKSTFDIYAPKLKGMEYGSEEYKKTLKEMEGALEHHYSNNRHHPEHYEDGISGMNLVDLMEMVADWKAASEKSENGSIEESIKKNQERFGYGDEVKNILKNTAREYFNGEGVD